MISIMMFCPGHHISIPRISINVFICIRMPSHYQIGAVIVQEGKNTSLSTAVKLTGPYKRYTKMENELISIVETLREFFHNFIRSTVRIFTDHKI